MKHILIVDNDDTNCMMAKRALEQNYRVTAVHSGKEALFFLEREIPDLVLIDIEMQEMNGAEVIKRMKEHEEWAKIPVIFLTANAEPEAEAECLKLGADDFIVRPFAPVVMESRVSRSLKLQELRKDLEEQLEKKTQQMEMATLKSLTDALTGLHNRVFLEKRLYELLDGGHQGSLFMIDLDNFKTINDTHGHIIGDKTLQYFAEVLKSHTDENDIVCRLAGDEFVVFYTDLTDKEKVAKKAEGIIKQFAEKMGALGYGGIVSVSIGIMITKGYEEFQTLYNKADKSLYFVKNNGKNAYRFYGEQEDIINEISTIVDLEFIQCMMEEGLDAEAGAFHLAYDEFRKIYDFVSRSVNRKRREVQIALFTLNVKVQTPKMEVENVMQLLENSVISSLRAVDAGTRYSNSQYILILIDTDLENGRKVVQRVIEKFYESSGISRESVEIFYDIRTMEPKVND